MTSEDQIKRLFDGVAFRGEPPMASVAADDLRRGQRHLRTRRIAAWGSGAAGLAAVATGVAFAFPGGGPATSLELEVAGSADTSPVTANEPETTSDPDAGDAAPSDPPTEEAPDDADQLPFPETLDLLLQVAREHLDPAGAHLPDKTTNAGTGGVGGDPSGGPITNWQVGTKLDWTIPGEDGMGMVQVIVTTPGFVSSEPYALEDVAGAVGCDVTSGDCTERTIPGTDLTAWVVENGPEPGRQLAVVHKRADGSVVAIGVNELFGNNSEVPVSHVDVDLEQAFAFVTDPRLEVDAEEAATEATHWEDEIGSTTPPEGAGWEESDD